MQTSRTVGNSTTDNTHHSLNMADGQQSINSDGYEETLCSVSDSLSVHELAGRRSQSFNDDNEGRSEELARHETKAVQWLRVAVILVLIGTAFAVCAATFLFTRLSEAEDFKAAFHDEAARVVEAFRINADTRVGAIEVFAMTITSHAQFANQTWPFVTLPDFERRGMATSALAQVMSIIMVPLVTDETREAWEEYSVANQGWLAEDERRSGRDGWLGRVPCLPGSRICSEYDGFRTSGGSARRINVISRLSESLQSASPVHSRAC